MSQSTSPPLPLSFPSLSSLFPNPTPEKDTSALHASVHLLVSFSYVLAQLILDKAKMVPFELHSPFSLDRKFR
jgi:hypothetical protein